MSYSLVLTEAVDERTKDVGQNVFLDHLSDKYRVFILYYPGELSPNEKLYDSLRKLGNSMGNNLLVNRVMMADPWYSKTLRKFDIKSFPVIVVTAIAELASLEARDRFLTAYIRNYINGNPRSIELIVKLIQLQYELFISEELSKELREVQRQEVQVQRQEVQYGNIIPRIEDITSRIEDITSSRTKEIKRFLEKDISIQCGLTEGKFDVRPRFQ
jgi:hypothetical protein